MCGTLGRASTRYRCAATTVNCLHTVLQTDLPNLQGERQSIAYFSNARMSTVFQGPLKRYPPITFAQIMEQKRGKDLPVNPEQLDPVDYLRSEMQTRLSCSRIWFYWLHNLEQFGAVQQIDQGCCAHCRWQNGYVMGPEIPAAAQIAQ